MDGLRGIGTRANAVLHSQSTGNLLLITRETTLCKKLIFFVALRQQVVESQNQDTTMVFTLYALLEAALLCINAIAVLNEQRFLAKGNS